MGYTLMHKTLPVIDFFFDEDDASILELDDVHHSRPPTYRYNKQR